MPNPRELVTPRQYPREPRRRAPAGLLGFTTAAAIAAMMLVYIDASNPELTIADAEQRAQQSLKQYGYNWARVQVTDGVAQLNGQAPGESERVIAYELVRKALRPMMGRSGPVEAISSRITLSAEGEARLAKATESRTRMIAEAEPRTLAAETATRGAGIATQEQPDISAATAAAAFVPSTGAADQPSAEGATLAAAPSVAAATPPAQSAEQRVAEVAQAPVEAPAIVSDASHVAGHVAVASPPAGANIETSAVDTAPHHTAAHAADAPAASPAPSAAATPAAVAATAPSADETSPETPSASAASPGQFGSKSDCKAEFADTLASTTIVFGSDSATIDKQSRPLLDKLAAIAKRCSRFSLVVEGHTDGSGRKGHNNALSKKRAEAVRWALIDRGVDMDHITAEGFGSARPIDRSGSAEAKARNRRIEFSVLEPAANERKAAATGAR